MMSTHAGNRKRDGGTVEADGKTSTVASGGMSGSGSGPGSPIDRAAAIARRRA